MDRRGFLRLGAASAVVAVLPAGCTSGPDLPPILSVPGPSAAFADGTRIEARPDAHALVFLEPGGERRVGRLGTAPGQLNYPIGVVVQDELAYVVEMGNHRVQVFDRAGASVRLIGTGELAYPAGIAATAAGELLVSDSGNGRLVAFMPGGAITRTLGGGRLSSPRGLAVLGGNVLVADVGLRRVVELDPHAHVERTFGEGWVLPWSVATDGERVFVGDVATSELAVFDRRGVRQAPLVLDQAPRFVALGADGALYVS